MSHDFSNPKKIQIESQNTQRYPKYPKVISAILKLHASPFKQTWLLIRLRFFWIYIFLLVGVLRSLTGSFNFQECLENAGASLPLHTSHNQHEQPITSITTLL